MSEPTKPVPLVGQYIKRKRLELNLSQRELGLRFEPPVTTQFISNLERGVTALPPVHVFTLVRALKAEETELRGLLEREYARKLTGRLGGVGDGATTATENTSLLPVAISDLEPMSRLYDAWRSSGPDVREELMATVARLAKIAW